MITDKQKSPILLSQAGWGDFCLSVTSKILSYFKFFYLFLGKSGILHDQIDVNAISKHIPGNIQGFLVHTSSLVSYAISFMSCPNSRQNPKVTG